MRHDGTFAVCRLEPDAPVPPWAWEGAFHSVTRTASELSVVCAWDAVPSGVQALGALRDARRPRPAGSRHGRRAGRVGRGSGARGDLVFAVATFDTDWLLVSVADAERAVATLRAAGYVVD